MSRSVSVLLLISDALYICTHTIFNIFLYIYPNFSLTTWLVPKLVGSYWTSFIYQFVFSENIETILVQWTVLKSRFSCKDSLSWNFSEWKQKISNECWKILLIHCENYLPKNFHLSFTITYSRSVSLIIDWWNLLLSAEFHYISVLVTIMRSKFSFG